MGERGLEHAAEFLAGMPAGYRAVVNRIRGFDIADRVYSRDLKEILRYTAKWNDDLFVIESQVVRDEAEDLESVGLEPERLGYSACLYLEARSGDPVERENLTHGALSLIDAALVTRRGLEDLGALKTLRVPGSHGTYFLLLDPGFIGRPTWVAAWLQGELERVALDTLDIRPSAIDRLLSKVSIQSVPGFPLFAHVDVLAGVLR